MTTRIRGQEFYLVEELIDILPVGKQSITNYLRTKKLKGIKLGRKWYVPRVEVDRFLDPRYHENIKSLKKDIQS